MVTRLSAARMVTGFVELFVGAHGFFFFIATDVFVDCGEVVDSPLSTICQVGQPLGPGFK